MKSVVVDPWLQSNYNDYYDDSVARWRNLGAIDKVFNIVSMCGSQAPEDVIFTSALFQGPYTSVCRQPRRCPAGSRDLRTTWRRRNPER